jgi:hypothetical protein
VDGSAAAFAFVTLFTITAASITPRSINANSSGNYVFSGVQMQTVFTPSSPLGCLVPKVRAWPELDLTRRMKSFTLCRYEKIELEKDVYVYLTSPFPVSVKGLRFQARPFRNYLVRLEAPGV